MPSATELAAIVAVSVTLALPSILTLPLKSPSSVIVLAVAHLLAVLALPLSAAVIVPALKLPLASRATILFTVFALVASALIVMLPAPFVIVILFDVPVSVALLRVLPVLLPINH